MSILFFSRYALTSCVASAMLAACGGSQPPVGAPGAAAQTEAIATQAARGKSWMQREAKTGDLLYVSNIATSLVKVFSYPRGRLLAKIRGFAAPSAGLCSDKSGNVFVTTYGLDQSNIYEYAHGGTTPIATLTDMGSAVGCSVDPNTGNLAVANFSNPGSRYGYGNIAIYEHAEGVPVTYSDPEITNFTFCAYDNNSNLFADDGYEYASGIIGEVPAGSSAFNNISLSQNIGPASLQWWRGALVAAGMNHSKHGAQPIYQIHVSGSTGTVSGPTLLSSEGNRHPGAVQFWLQGNTMIGPDYHRGGNGIVNFWPYAQGGNPKQTLSAGVDSYGVTISVAPKG